MSVSATASHRQAAGSPEGSQPDEAAAGSSSQASSRECGLGTGGSLRLPRKSNATAQPLSDAGPDGSKGQLPPIPPQQQQVPQPPRTKRAPRGRVRSAHQLHKPDEAGSSSQARAHSASVKSVWQQGPEAPLRHQQQQQQRQQQQQQQASGPGFRKLGDGQGLAGSLKEQQLEQCRQRWKQQLQRLQQLQPAVSGSSGSWKQRQVAAAVRRLPSTVVEPGTVLEEEIVEDDACLTDIVCTSACGRQLVIEVDGPQHYRYPDQAPTGSTMYRNRALKARDYVLVVIRVSDWDKCSQALREQQLTDWIQQALQ
ncbi:hypothetical protein OEZ85_014102 [Tetradesmus obliquus]|uniref:RAP domain-containing protein n=1 Tax=Tetradesmus obliquus TaxID=3088 RepID=A0ABY8UC21_TETOB|nr:hypothetical protein OEZ85_014102 [Tetradesmus obliquus]